MRCAIYARYSSDMQKQTSIEDQVRECRQFIERRQWELADGRVYSDYAISGADANRSGYLALKADAFKKQFDCIVVDEFDVLGNLLPLNLLPKAFALMYKAGERTRTPDLLITNQLLYQLSYTGLRYLLVVQDDRHPDRQD